MRVQKFIRQPGVPVDTAIRVYRRYLKLEPEHAEEYIAYLKAKVRARPLSPHTPQFRMFAHTHVREHACAHQTVQTVTYVCAHACLHVWLHALVYVHMPTRAQTQTAQHTHTHTHTHMHSQNRWGEAAQKLAELLNDETFRSLEGKSKHQVGAAHRHAGTLASSRCPLAELGAGPGETCV